ncbi:uncharacterized protein EV422DRAFT_300665 [Fimicolochytrium jonesii]|uniref:uncharacterized protein n=1 Tax=Fimicolochytrium jonesii TaxID=1396493 RepID=UPI0022FDC669|nr:uncharacterized protein EV422DRAFT_371679 [Fimicolochytrium jonesii]XP_052921230.1 uncharacterized protein EV422DRAFT_300665 [Fimicolochytrium jonesii]KAI8815597.1 hypothetical protein EV422DRAFT_371679 [Fimicolochytrium jonesii]KAI8816261.1 hypothetical protein EV422DRAFT_300665 [Fimicolochytrium jonesii]
MGRGWGPRCRCRQERYPCFRTGRTLSGLGRPCCFPPAAAALWVVPVVPAAPPVAGLLSRPEAAFLRASILKVSWGCLWVGFWFFFVRGFADEGERAGSGLWMAFIGVAMGCSSVPVPASVPPTGPSSASTQYSRRDPFPHQ